MISNQQLTRMVLIMTTSLLLAWALNPGAAAAQQSGPASEGRKLLRVSAEVTYALTQASNQNAELLRWAQRQGRCWGRVLSAYSQATGGELQGGAARYVILPYVALSQQQAFQRGTFGTANWGRGKLQASRPIWKTATTGSGGLISKSADSGGLTIPSRPAPWEPIYRGYRAYINNLRPLSEIKVQNDPCALLQQWQEQNFTGAWKLVAAASGVKSWQRLDRLFRTRIVASEVDAYRASRGLQRLLAARGQQQRRIDALALGPYRRLSAVYSRALRRGLDQPSER